nr:efflux RND transporter periplasmic adaptor subunit [Breznakibacter sp.]
MRKYLLSSAALVVLLVFGCTSKTEQKRVVAPVIVDVLVASNGEFTSTVELNGSVLSDEWVELRPEVSGRLIFLDIPDGGVVTKGTVLA